MFTSTSLRKCIFLGSLCCLALGWWRFTPVASTQPATSPVTRANPLHWPHWFEPNRGQAARDVLFFSRSRAATLALTAQGARWYVSEQTPVELRFRHAQASPRGPQGLEPLPGRSHYLLGKTRLRDVTHFARVAYDQLYPGIDLVFYGQGYTLEYDLLVAPQADPRRIELAFAGAQGVRLNERGDLVLSLPCGEIIQKAPVAYQPNGQRVAARYALDAQQRVRFVLGAYDRTQPLVIDPVIEYSTYLGGESSDQGFAITTDAAGNAYVTGTTNSLSFPGPSPIQARRGGGNDVFVAKLNATGTGLLWATYLGGSNSEQPNALALDANNNVIVTGQTFSTDFPLTVDAAQRTPGGGSEAFITKLDASGSSLMFSTLFGGNGSDTGLAVAADAAGNVIAAGATSSTDLPNLTLSGAAFYQSTNRGDNWGASTKGLGGNSISVLAVDPSDNQHLVAQTEAGTYNTTDGGANWTRVNNLVSFATGIVFDPKRSNTHYLVGSFGGLVRTLNGGANYDTLLVRAGNTQANSLMSLAIDPTDTRILYAGAQQGLFKSTDGGSSWTLLPIPQVFSPISVSQIALDPTNPLIVYAATAAGLIKSVNGGAAWTTIPIPAAPSFSTYNALVVDPKNPQTVYVATSLFNLSVGTVFKTTDGGATWQSSSSGLSYQFGAQTIPLGISKLALDPTTPTTLYAAAQSGGLFRSTDGGATWSLTRNGLNNRFIRALAVDSTGVVSTGAAAGSDGFLVRLNAGGTAFTQARLLGGSEGDEARGLAFDHNGNLVVAGSTLAYDFPTRNPLQANNRGFSDFQPTTESFVARLNPQTFELLNSTYLGGAANDQVRALTTDGAGNVYLVGNTTSLDFPVTPNAWQASKSGGTDFFVTRLNAAQTALTFSTYLGGNREDLANGIAVDSGGQIYVTGQSNSTDYPAVNAVHGPTFLFQQSSTVRDAVVSKFSANGATLLFSSYLGGANDEVGLGIAVDGQRNFYVTGGTSSVDFPTFAPLRGDGQRTVDGFVTKFAPRADLALSNAAQHSPVMAGKPYSYTATVSNLGADEATDVRLTTNVPANLTNVTITSSAGATACTGTANVQCRLGELALGATATVTIAGTAPATGTLEFTTNVTSATGDPVTANNRATLTTTVQASPSLAGRVVLADGTPLAGATLNLTGSATATRQSSASGAYQFTELMTSGSYNIAAQRAGYVLRPLTLNFTNVQSDQVANFTATACVFNVTSTATAFLAAGGSATFTVTAADALCPWQARANDPWLTVSAPGGVGNSSVNVTVAPTNIARTGSVTIGGRTLPITQEAGACAAPNLRIAQTLDFPRSGQQLAEGDFNGDQLTDVVLFDAQNVAVLLGNGTGGFGAPQSVALGLAQESITTLTVGDLNGDGRGDLVVSAFRSQATGTITLLTLLANAGAGGGFAAPRRTTLPGSANAVTLATALLNNDNRADVITADSNGSANTWLSGADGALTASGAALQVFSVQAIASGDFNQDNRTDVVFGTAGSNGIVLYQGDGTGRLQAPLTIATGLNSLMGLAVADMNRDDNPDVAASGFFPGGTVTQGQVLVLAGDGAGRLSTPVRYAALSAAGRLAARDFTGDGLPDLAVVNLSGGLSLFVNSAEGLRPAIHYAAGSVSNSLVVTDLERDNRLDVVLVSDSTNVNPQTGAVPGWLILLKGAGADFNAGRDTVLPSNVSVATVATGDFNNDGRADSVALQFENTSGGQTYALVTRFSAGNVFAGEIRTETTEQLALTARDFNRDGKLDLIARGVDTITLYAGDGTGRFQLAVRLNSPQPALGSGTVQVRNPLPLALADFDRDGRDDIVTFDTQRQPALFLGGATSFSAARSFGVGANVNDLYAGDFNGDGNADVLALFPFPPFCTNAGASVLLFLGDGQGGFAAGRRFVLPVQPNFLLVEDLNSDGRADVAAAGGCFTGAQAALLFGTANGELLGAPAVTLPYDPLALTAGDLNNDGRKDLLVAVGVAQGASNPVGLYALLQRPTGDFAPPALLGPLERSVYLAVADFTGDGLNDVFSFNTNLSTSFPLTLTILPNNCLTTRPLSLASAASFGNAALAPDSIVAAFGTGLATATTTATATPLPLELAGTRVSVTDSALVERAARLYFVAPTQVNFLLPLGTLPGAAQVRLISGDNLISTSTVQIAAVAPGLFTANADGRGVPAALVLRVRSDGVQLYEPLAQRDAASQRFVPLPIDFGLASDQLFLVLYGTGLRGRTALANVTARIGGVSAPVLYAGPQNDLVGVDQINVGLPRELRGRGEVDVQLTVDGQTTNVVRIALR